MAGNYRSSGLLFFRSDKNHSGADLVVSTYAISACSIFNIFALDKMKTDRTANIDNFSRLIQVGT